MVPDWDESKQLVVSGKQGSMKIYNDVEISIDGVKGNLISGKRRSCQRW